MIKKLFLAVIASCLFVFSGCDLFDTDSGVPEIYAIYMSGHSSNGIESIDINEGHKCVMTFHSGDMTLWVYGTWTGKAVPRASGESFTVNFTSLKDIQTGLPPTSYSGFKLNTDYEFTFEKEEVETWGSTLNYVKNDTLGELWHVLD